MASETGSGGEGGGVRRAEFGAQCGAVLEGRSTFDAFARATRKTWRRLADYVLGRWWQPDWVERADVEQDLLLGAWVAIGKWRPGHKGWPVGRYVVWNAVNHAKKRAHRARGAALHRNEDRNPPRHDIAFAAFRPKPGSDLVSDDGEALWLAARASEEGDQERVADWAACVAEAYRVGCASDVDHIVVDELLFGGDLRSAAGRLYVEPDVRLACGLGCEEDAVALARRSVERTRGRLEAAAA